MAGVREEVTQGKCERRKGGGEYAREEPLNITFLSFFFFCWRSQDTAVYLGITILLDSGGFP